MLKYGWLNSSDKYYAYQRLDKFDLSVENSKMTVLKNEVFAVQLILWSDQVTHYTFDHDSISWRGIHLDTYRIEASPWQHISTNENVTCPVMSFVGYVNDDEGRWVSDPLLRDRGIEREAGSAQGLWIESCFSKENRSGIYSTQVTIYRQNGYDEEVVVDSLSLHVELLNGHLIEPERGDFFLDLWQHPSNWARAYKVKLWSDEHFSIIESHLKAMARLGQKVVTIIASDYPWAGQGCYGIPENSANLFEHNMIQISKNEDGTFSYNFEYMKRYIEVAKRVGIKEEIDIFGLLGNWDAYAFGNPVVGYRDPIRLKYKNKISNTFGYLSEIEDVQNYISALFAELYKMGIWEKIRVICDEPDHPIAFNENVDFLRRLSKQQLKIKSAVHVPEIMPEIPKLMDDVSLGMNILGHEQGDVSHISDAIKGKLTWYVCCFPNRPNNFLSSPRLESRMIGWLTHYFGLDGFLRWDFAIWPESPFTNTRYKYPKWTAGDMFFVYPGKDMKPIRSQRLENLFFGIQDFQLMKYIDEHGTDEAKDILKKKMTLLLGEKEHIAVDGLNVDMAYSLEYDHYMALKHDMMLLVK